MKNIAKYIGFFALLSLITGINTGCDLTIQEPYEFTPAVPDLITFKDKTVWDWLQTQKSSDTATVKSTNKFDLMIAAITYAGLEEEYKSGSNQTFILLNNNVFTASNEINVALTGKTAGPITTADKTRLTNLLKYHIINAYVDQLKALPVYSTYYEFETKSAVANNKIYVSRNDRYTMNFNGSTDLPATRKAANVAGHNYVFSNGIGHIVNNYTRVAAF